MQGVTWWGVVREKLGAGLLGLALEDELHQSALVLRYAIKGQQDRYELTDVEK